MVTGYFGLPGSGKTTFLSKIAQKELKRINKGKSPYERVLLISIVKAVRKSPMKN